MKVDGCQIETDDYLLKPALLLLSFLYNFDDQIVRICESFGIAIWTFRFLNGCHCNFTFADSKSIIMIDFGFVENFSLLQFLVAGISRF